MRRLGLAAVVAVLLASCGTGGDGKSLTFVSYGKGAYQDGQQKGFLEPYQKDTGVKVVLDGPSDNAKLRAMVEAGRVTWDVVDTDAFMAREHCGTLLEKIDVGPLKDSFPPGTLSECGVPAALFGLMLMYNEKTYGANPPTSLADFFDPVKFPGKRVVYAKDPSTGQLEAALLADGVPVDKLYPLDMDRAMRMYGKIRRDLTLAQTYGQQQQVMVDNQADMALIVSARAYSTLKAGGTQWKRVSTKVPVTWDVFVVPKGSKHKDLAQELIKYASGPEQGAKFAELSGAGAANTAAKSGLNDIQRQIDVLSPQRAADAVFINADWWTGNYSRVVQTWTSWQTG
ncbi:extracellular solute-binding protein [Kibdelosporangium phytohabitans]|uniref:Polyamine ABC transporter substrate-binding protein n=1 Tax=Kibdelosporangium phytohabitans TaxID=860235 RepID=A0A0N9I7X2_9PSEU|nr:extracellular solute-binding protein [Kibdelosporangium phytohabitans]ALG10608.1 polyamine ABC transporter substrate-binding protein [Kibdelosporangium phytohabitans]MBE1461722.1 putative spermidine/putrescine transport system substrate-binding protein [Kibdelosporangium phytohabitans]